MRQFFVIASIAIIIGLGVVVIASAFAGNEGDQTIQTQPLVTGPAVQKASAAALRFIGGGTVDAVTHDYANGASYGVAVSQPGGSEIEVHLDRHFKPLGIDAGAVGSDGGDGGD
jgi:hypothetical protein